MREFILVFRRDYHTEEVQPTAEQIANFLKPWQDWYSELESGGKLARPIRRLDAKGRIVFKDNVVTSGPYKEVKESIGGMIAIRAESYEEADEIVKCCPILQLGINVEIRITPDL